MKVTVLEDPPVSSGYRHRPHKAITDESSNTCPTLSRDGLECIYPSGSAFGSSLYQRIDEDGRIIHGPFESHQVYDPRSSPKLKPQPIGQQDQITIRRWTSRLGMREPVIQGTQEAITQCLPRKASSTRQFGQTSPPQEHLSDKPLMHPEPSSSPLFGPNSPGAST